MLRHFFIALAYVVNLVLWIYMWLIIIRALLSWVSPDPYNPVVRFFYAVTEPTLRAVRRYTPSFLQPWQLGVDLSPVIVIFIIIFLQQFLVPILHEIARMVT